ncbi:MAG TPA: hypothetical protein VMB73_03135, partial [Acetobacteraceae bacterium]|nr:hypothetical protein [Acetobacteraceae bacterium]
MPERLLFVVISTARAGEHGPPTGLWLEELSVPYLALHDAGAAVDMQDKVPFLLDERLASLGARLVKGDAFEPMAVAHDHLITGQNPT